MYAAKPCQVSSVINQHIFMVSNYLQPSILFQNSHVLPSLPFVLGLVNTCCVRFDPQRPNTMYVPKKGVLHFGFEKNAEEAK
jgi:hypothetical protein